MSREHTGYCTENNVFTNFICELIFGATLIYIFSSESELKDRGKKLGESTEKSRKLFNNADALQNLSIQHFEQAERRGRAKSLQLKEHSLPTANAKLRKTQSEVRV